MSSRSPVTCLFCQHINPADASFCNSCAAQLNLKPCAHCDAVDDVLATQCYKCGTPFPLREMSEPVGADTPGSQDAAQPAPFLDKATSPPSQEALAGENATRASEASRSPREATASDMVSTDARDRPGWLMPLTAFLLLLLAISAYMYLRQPEKKTLSPFTKPVVQMAPVVSTPPATAAELPQVNVLTTPSASSSSPTTTDEAFSHRTPSLEIDCVPAVAALALCNPETGQGKP